MAWGERPSRGVPWLAVCAAAAFVLPMGASAEERASARRIFAALDVAAEIERVAPVAIAQLETLREAPAADRALLREIIVSGFAAPSLERRALAAFHDRFDANLARAAADWLARPEIRRLYAASQARTTGCDPAASSPARTRAMARIRAATSVEARSRSHAIDALVTLLREANRVLPRTRRYPPAELARLVAAQRAARPALDRSWSCAYREFPTRTLVAAQAFLEGDAGRWLHASVSAAVLEALSQAARATAVRIVDHLGDPDPRRAPLRIARSR